MERRSRQDGLRIAQMKADGMTHEEVAHALGCSIATVTRHLTRIYGSLRVNNIHAALDELERRELIEKPELPDIQIGLDSLPSQQKTLAQLLLQGLTNAQIAEQLGVTPNAVRIRVHHLTKQYGISTAVLVEVLKRDNPLS